jgi:hypothetical protein
MQCQCGTFRVCESETVSERTEDRGMEIFFLPSSSRSVLRIDEAKSLVRSVSRSICQATSVDRGLSEEDPMNRAHRPHARRQRWKRKTWKVPSVSKSVRMYSRLLLPVVAVLLLAALLPLLLAEARPGFPGAVTGNWGGINGGRWPLIHRQTGRRGN